MKTIIAVMLTAVALQPVAFNIAIAETPCQECIRWCQGSADPADCYQRHCTWQCRR